MSDVLRMGSKWEYLRVAMYEDGGRFAILNELGMEGWEAFSVVCSDGYTYSPDESGTSKNDTATYHVYLKRPFSIVNRGSLVKGKL